MENADMHELLKDDELYQSLPEYGQAVYRKSHLEWLAENQRRLDEVDVSLFFPDATKEEQLAAVEIMLRRCHPVTVGKKVIQLERFNIR